MDPVTRLLAQLVAIPSVNPMGRALSGPGYHEAGMTAFLLDFLGGLGVPVERREVAPGRANVLARYDAPHGRRAVLFDVHQDTVPVDGMTVDPFRPTIEGGRLAGRGACDIKGAMAAMLLAFERLVRERPEGSASVVLACTVDEEYTHIGSSDLADRLPPVDLAVVAEPTRLDLVDCHKGAVRWKVRARGVACHSSTPRLGRNAIYAMAEVVAALAGHAEVLADEAPHPALGPPSLSVGRIEGGQSVNVVPDWAEIDVDRRLIPGEDPARAIARARAAVAGRVDRMEDVDFLPPWTHMPALAPRPADDPWGPILGDAIASVRGVRPRTLGVPFGTDAGPLAAAGLPCFVFGPGDIAQAHTRDEWVDLDEVRLAVDLYVAIARALG